MQEPLSLSGHYHSQPLLEEVYKTSGVPTFTFVEPKEWSRLLVSLRTPGRGVVVEGPSGIGKTSAVERAIHELHLQDTCTKLSARKKSDVDYIKMLPECSNIGLVVVDDFHKLDEDTRRELADFMKVLADEERKDSKIVVLGINKAGDALIHFATDLATRIDIITFATEPEYKLKELIEKGQSALDISLNVADEIVHASQGSFYIAQMLCKRFVSALRFWAVVNRMSQQRSASRLLGPPCGSGFAHHSMTTAVILAGEQKCGARVEHPIFTFSIGWQREKSGRSR
jgi:hypothetical protein